MAAWLGVAFLCRPEQPMAKPLTAKQQARLKERDRLAAEAKKFAQQGKLPEMFAALKRKLAIEREVFGEVNTEVVASPVFLARLHEAVDDFKGAAKARQGVVVIRTKLHWAWDWRVTDAKLDLEDLKLRSRLSPEGRKRLEEATTRSENVENLWQEGRFKVALPLAQRVANSYSQILGKENRLYATSLNNLGVLYQAMGDYRTALPLLEMARDLRRKLLTENHTHYVTSLNNLATLYHIMGDYQKALPLYEKARDLRRKLLSENHTRYATSLNNLAMLYLDMGDYHKALPLLEKARDLKKKLLTENHPDYASSIHNLAWLYQYMGDYPKALALFEKAQDLRRKLLTENHPDYATSLSSLAGVYQAMGDYQKALPLLEKAREIFKKRLTENHPHYATSITNLAGLYQEMGAYQKALPLYEKARDLRRKLLTENHPYYATSLNNLAMLLFCLKKPKEAAPLMQRALTIDKAFLDNTFTAQSYRQRLDFLHQLKVRRDIFLTVSPQADVPCGRLYDQVLAWKGALALRQVEEHLAHDHPGLQTLLDDLRQVRAGLAHLARKPAATAAQQAEWLQRFAGLERDKEKLETRLAQKSEVFRRSVKLRQPSTKKVQKVLPAGTALVDFVSYTHFTPPPKGKGRLVIEEKLLAFVITPDQEPVAIKLGPAEAIDKAVQVWRKAMVQYQGLDQTGKELARLLWQPLQPHLRKVKTVLLSPDGPVCGLPFAALPGKRAGTYLVEELAIGYVTSGRQLLELDAAKDKRRGHGLLTVGGLPYGKASPSSPATADLWKDLPGTLLESERVARIFSEAFSRSEPPRQLQGEAVDAAALKRELPPVAKARRRFLHLATHGYFEAPAPYHPGPRGASGEPTFDMMRDYYTYGRNPLVRSGLVLAGANRSAAQGILTAEEVADLDLRGVELAVLSACDTGLGKQAAGEGVLGLQRAFQASGARSLLISLWSVNDAATSVLMEEFYTNLWTKKMSKLKALQEAQRTVLRNPARVARRAGESHELLAKRGVSEEDLTSRGIGKQAGDLPRGAKVQKRSHPALWAAFVLSGDGK
jgi:CHAT domain-containing protein/Tfp pilus assembly protein PilF